MSRCRVRLSRHPVTLVLVFWVIAVISACSSREPLRPTVLVDDKLERVSRGANRAFSKGEYEQAAELYREALDYAYARDDREAIVDTQYNLAVTSLRLGALDASRAAVDGAKVELSRTARAIPADLQLVDATLLYYTGQAAVAWDISEQLLADADAIEPEVLARLHFLRGLIAVERGDIKQLRTSVVRLETANHVALAAERTELRGRLEMAERNLAAAVDALAAAAALHREGLDYPNMARALALAGEASGRLGRLQEATLFFFRAGRSASRLDMEQQALEWLTRAREFAQHTGDTRMIMDIFSHLTTLKARASREGR